jgi:hypothetical protein
MENLKMRAFFGILKVGRFMTNFKTTPSEGADTVRIKY